MTSDPSTILPTLKAYNGSWHGPRRDRGVPDRRWLDNGQRHDGEGANRRRQGK